MGSNFRDWVSGQNGADFSECIVDTRLHRGWRDKLRNAVPCYVPSVAARRGTGLPQLKEFTCPDPVLPGKP